jgi:hypothetical protein
VLDLAARVAATDKVIARFRHRPFSWRNRTTCIHLARAQMWALGHRPPSIPDFRSPIGARTALRKAGVASLVELLDGLAPRIAPLAMLPGDLGVLPGEPPFEAIVIAGGGDKVFCWHGADLSRLHPIAVRRLDFIACYGLAREAHR